MEPVAREPTLETVLIVEKAILHARSYPTRKEPWRSLPKQVQYQTFNRILDYLASSNKILLDKGQIVWTFPSNEKLKKLLHTSVRLR